MEFQGLGRLIIILGISLVVIGLLITFAPKIPLLGKLPGDFYFKRGNASFYFPPRDLATDKLNNFYYPECNIPRQVRVSAQWG
jgi:hypothetical protein